MQNQITLNEHRHRVVRVHDGEIFRLVVEINVDDLKVHAFFVQDDAALMAERVGRAGI